MKFNDDLEKRIDALKDHNDILHKRSLETIKSYKNFILK